MFPFSALPIKALLLTYSVIINKMVDENKINDHNEPAFKCDYCIDNKEPVVFDSCLEHEYHIQQEHEWIWERYYNSYGLY